MWYKTESGNNKNRLEKQPAICRRTYDSNHKYIDAPVYTEKDQPYNAKGWFIILKQKKGNCLTWLPRKGKLYSWINTEKRQPGCGICKKCKIYYLFRYRAAFLYSGIQDWDHAKTDHFRPCIYGNRRCADALAIPFGFFPSKNKRSSESSCLPMVNRWTGVLFKRWRILFWPQWSFRPSCKRRYLFAWQLAGKCEQ